MCVHEIAPGLQTQDRGRRGEILRIKPRTQQRQHPLPALGGIMDTLGAQPGDFGLQNRFLGIDKRTGAWPSAASSYATRTTPMAACTLSCCDRPEAAISPGLTAKDCTNQATSP